MCDSRTINLHYTKCVHKSKYNDSLRLEKHMWRNNSTYVCTIFIRTTSLHVALCVNSFFMIHKQPHDIFVLNCYRPKNHFVRWDCIHLYLSLINGTITNKYKTYCTVVLPVLTGYLMRMAQWSSSCPNTGRSCDLGNLIILWQVWTHVTGCISSVIDWWPVQSLQYI